MPQRPLKPQICTSELWNSCSDKGQSLFIRLLTVADEYGRCDAKPTVVFSECGYGVYNLCHPEAPVTLPIIEAMIDEIAAHNLVDIYVAGGRRIMQINQWEIKPRAGTVSVFPSKQIVEKAELAFKLESEDPDVPKMPGIDEAFKMFWDAWPTHVRKSGPNHAKVVFARLKCNTYIKEVLEGLERCKKSQDWLKNGGEFIPGPSPWLNQQKWDNKDAYATTSSPTNGSAHPSAPQDEVWPICGGKFTLSRAPTREDFPSDSSFTAHNSAYLKWKASRVTIPAPRQP